MDSLLPRVHELIRQDCVYQMQLRKLGVSLDQLVLALDGNKLGRAYRENREAHIRTALRELEEEGLTRRFVHTGDFGEDVTHWVYVKRMHQSITHSVQDE